MNVFIAHTQRTPGYQKNISAKCTVTVKVNTVAHHCALMCVSESVFYKCLLRNQRTLCCMLSICALLVLFIFQAGLLLPNLLNEKGSSVQWINGSSFVLCVSSLHSVPSAVGKEDALISLATVWTMFKVWRHRASFILSSVCLHKSLSLSPLISSDCRTPSFLRRMTCTTQSAPSKMTFKSSRWLTMKMRMMMRRRKKMMKRLTLMHHHLPLPPLHPLLLLAR